MRDARAAAEADAREERVAAEFREEFIAILGHDLRNPLAAMTSGLRMLEKEQVSERGRKVLKLMDGSILRASTLVNNVMDFARTRFGGGIGIVSDADTNIAPVIHQVVVEARSIAGEKQIEALIEIDTPVEADRGRIGQLVSNLLGNAITHGAPDQPIRLAARTSAGQLEIRVSNAGEPIPPEALRHLFRPFVRGSAKQNQQGLGLGLHIASEIASAHQGELKASSDDTETCFVFAMPCRRPPTTRKLVSD